MLTSKDIHGNEYQVDAHDLAWRPSGYGIVLHDDKLLVVNLFGKYHLPGGGIDLGEDPKAATLREIKEETGIIAADPKLVNAESTFFTWETIDQPSKFEHVQSLLLYYVCDYVGGTLGAEQLDEYETEAGQTPEWVDIAELDGLPVGSTVDWRPAVRKLVQG